MPTWADNRTYNFEFGDLRHEGSQVIRGRRVYAREHEIVDRRLLKVGGGLLGLPRQVVIGNSRSGVLLVVFTSCTM